MQCSPDVSPSKQSSDPSEGEGSINKQILLSIGSMAQLKHPRKFWPKVSSASENRLEIRLSRDSGLVFNQASVRSQVMAQVKTRNMFGHSHLSPKQASA